MVIFKKYLVNNISQFQTFAFRFIISLLVPVIFYSFSFSQTTKITGKISDAETKNPLPFVNIAFKNSKIGTTSNMDGNFLLETYYPSDSIVASSVGYQTMAKKIKKDVPQVINFEMKTGSIELAEIVIKADKKAENPAHPIMRGVIEHKNANNREKLTSYEYEAYNKIEFDLNNIDEKFKQQKVLRPFNFIFDYVDTSEAKDFLPVFITETMSDFYFKKNPKSQKEIIKGSRISGIKNESVSQFMGDMYQNVNVYDNYITVFGKSFISPIADFWNITYNYYLMDSMFIGNNWCYKIRFLPKRKHELTFLGDLWVNDTTYAIKKVEATIAEDANINFVNELTVVQEYEQVEKEIWMLAKDKLVVDFALTNQTIGFYGRKTTSYRNFVVNRPKEKEFFSNEENIVIEDDADDKAETYWDTARHEILSNREKLIYHMVDTIQQVPAFKTYVDLVYMFLEGYKEWGKVEFGPYFSAFSFNRVEGNRFRFGMRTSNAFSKRGMLEGYVAYGTLDQRFKYGGSVFYFLSKKPRESVYFSYKNDVEQLGQGLNAWRQDNILASVFRRNPSIKLNGFEEYNIAYENELFAGFSNKLILSTRNIWPLERASVQFRHTDEMGLVASVNNIRTTEFSIHTRFAYQEKYVSGQFDRVSMGTTYPVVQLRYSFGVKNIFKSDYDYQRLSIVVSNSDITINPIGYSDLVVEGGKVFGKVPYPLLEIHNGNETYSYDKTAFNLMNYYEFVSDEYASVSLAHHFDGLFLNKIPLMRKLKWREIALFKGVAGHLSYDSAKILDFPLTLSSLSKKPYYEVGFGVENILKVIRLDALWRLSYINPEYRDAYKQKTGGNVQVFGLRATLQVIF